MLETSEADPDHPLTSQLPLLENGWIVIGIVLALAVWMVTLFTSLRGWIFVPVGLIFALIIRRGLKGSILYNVVVCGFTFMGVCSVGAYVTLLARYLLSDRQADPLIFIVDVAYLIFAFPVLIVVFLLWRGIKISLNADRCGRGDPS